MLDPFHRHREGQLEIQCRLEVNDISLYTKDDLEVLSKR